MRDAILRRATSLRRFIRRLNVRHNRTVHQINHESNGAGMREGRLVNEANHLDRELFVACRRLRILEIMTDQPQGE